MGCRKRNERNEEETILSDSSVERIATGSILVSSAFQRTRLTLFFGVSELSKRIRNQHWIKGGGVELRGEEG